MLDFRNQTHWSAAEYSAAQHRHRQHHPNLERLICAAVSNARFAALLVQAPEHALAQFEVGRLLTAAERRLVLAITDADDIFEFAGRLHALVSEMHSSESGALLPELEEAPAVEAPTGVRKPFRPAPAAIAPTQAVFAARPR